MRWISLNQSYVSPVMPPKVLMYKCQWINCQNQYQSYEELSSHLCEHLECTWHSTSLDVTCGICGELTPRDESSYRHIYFHAWLVHLYAKGNAYQVSEMLPICSLPGDIHSVPDFPTAFTCGWTNCVFQTNDISKFYLHVAKHPQEYNQGGGADYPDELHDCRWEGCTFSCQRLDNLAAHLRSHTQEKVIGCDRCGLLFTARVKLRDHLMRQHNQGAANNSEFQCGYCLRCFGNKSLLQAHVNRHVNKHICPLCKLTLHSKSAVKRHMIFRHTNATVECPYCPAKFKDIHCLRSHKSRCHKDLEPGGGDISAQFTPSGAASPERPSSPIGPLASARTASAGHLFPLQTSTPSCVSKVGSTSDRKKMVYKCAAPGCSFQCYNQPGLLTHLTRKHPEISPTTSGNYACHLCDMRTSRGFLLSRHLITKHNFQRPAGHFRFAYALCPEDGLYRLQTTRLDSVEVAATLLGPQAVGELLIEGGISDQES